MADDFTPSSDAGSTYGADEISSVKYPRIKLIHGADGTNDGDVSTANPLPVEKVPDVVTDSNSVSPTGTGAETILSSLQSRLSLTPEQMARYEWMITLYSTLDQAADVNVWGGHEAADNASGTVFTANNAIYSESGIVAASTGRLTLYPESNGTGAASKVKAVSALKGPLADMRITVQNSSPGFSSGTIYYDIIGRAR